MKKLLTAKTRWEFYASNITGLIIVAGLGVWFVILSIENGSIDFSSVFFWLAVALLFFVPFALITIFSAIENVVVTNAELTISYKFQKHKSVVRFSDIKKVHSKSSDQATKKSKLNDSFSVETIDGKFFEFSQSNLDNYRKLKEIVIKLCK